MDTTILSFILAISLIAIIVLIIYQSNPNSNTNKTDKEKFYPIIFDTCTHPREQGIHNQGLTQGAVYSGMPVHRVGPIINFHQSFKPFLPELGWRAIYLNNYNDYQVPPDTNFDGTMIRNFLNNLENVDNIYRKC